MKNNYYIDTRLLWRRRRLRQIMGHLAHGEIFENMLQLKRFGLYFEGILNRKWLLSYRNIDISYRDARGFWGHAPHENFAMIDAIWLVLMYYFDQIKS